MFQESTQQAQPNPVPNSSSLEGAAGSARSTEWRVTKEQLAAAERATLYHARRQASASATSGTAI